jgi:hypothetical protein
VSFSDSCYYNNSCKETQLWSAEDIVILTDGICGSTCSLFVEMMKNVGVRSVVVGGTPQQGPMQATSGTRAAAQYSGDELLYDFVDAIRFNSSVQALFPRALNDTGMALLYTGLSLRDQIRRNESVPNQMLYLPANCRIYWTLANFHNYTRLYMDAHDAIFVDNSRCVAGSTNVTAAPAPPSLANGPSTQVLSHDGLAYFINHPDLPNLISSSTSTSAVLSDNRVVRFRVCAYSESPAVCSQIELKCNGPCSDDGCGVRNQRDFKIPIISCLNGEDDRCPAGTECVEKAYILNTNPRNGIEFHGYQTIGLCEPVWNRRLESTLCTVLNSTRLERIVNGGFRGGISKR